MWLNIIIFILLTVAVACLALARAIFMYGKRQADHIYFALASLSASVWIFGFLLRYFAAYRYGLADVSFIFGQIADVATVSMLYFYILFAGSFPYGYVKQNNYFVGIITLLYSALCIMVFVPGAVVIKETFVFNGLPADLHPLTAWGPMYNWMFAPFVLLCFVFGIIFSVRAYMMVQEQDEEFSKMVRYSLWGTVTAGIIGLFFWFIAPQIELLSSYVWIARFTPLFLIGANAIAILRFGMFDIKIATFQLFSAFIVIVLFAQFAVSSTVKEMYVNGAMFSLVFIFIWALNRNIEGESRRMRELQGLSEKIHVANEQLKTKDVVKAHFLSFVSNQVAAPMQVIRDYAIRLENADMLSEDEAKNMSEKIVNTTDEAVHLVNNLLLLRKIEEGSLEYFMQEFSLTQLLRETMVEFAMFADEKHIGIVENIDEQPIFVWGDQARLRQVLQNIIENALRFTHEGGVVEIALAKKDTSVICSIKDSGVGMTSDVLQSLFTQFVRVFNTGTLETGRGMGVYVSAQVVIAHNGRIWAESDGINRGSVFHIQLPRIEAPKI